jgi:hypothetical protein
MQRPRSMRSMPSFKITICHCQRSIWVCMLPLKCASVHSLQYWYCEVAQLLQCMWHIPHRVRYDADDVTVQKYSEESEDRRQARC